MQSGKEHSVHGSWKSFLAVQVSTFHLLVVALSSAVLLLGVKLQYAFGSTYGFLSAMLCCAVMVRLSDLFHPGNCRTFPRSLLATLAGFVSFCSAMMMEEWSPELQSKINVSFTFTVVALLVRVILSFAIQMVICFLVDSIGSVLRRRR